METKLRKPMLCSKCRFHGQQHLYKDGHSRCCQYRDCPCDKCKSYEVARNIDNDLRAHVQKLEGNTQFQKDIKYEVDVKLKVKEEPMEYFSSDDESVNNANSVSLDISQDNENVTKRIILNQSGDLDLSDSDHDTSQNPSSVGLTQPQGTPPSSGAASEDLNLQSRKSNFNEVCPYCDIILVQPIEAHVKDCTTAKLFDVTEKSDNVDKYLESSTSDREDLNELDLPTPSTSSSFEHVAPVIKDTNADSQSFQLQCPICLADFSQCSPQELEAHAESCQDFYSPAGFKTCFMCDKEFSSNIPEIEFQNHVEDHFRGKDLQEQYGDLTVNYENKRKFDNESSSLKKMKHGDSLTSSVKTSLENEASRFPEIPNAKNVNAQFKGLNDLQKTPPSNQNGIGGKSPIIKQSPGSSHTLFKDKSSQIKQSPGSSHNQFQYKSSQIKQSPESSKIQLNEKSSQIKQSPSSSQTWVVDKFPKIKQSSPESSQTNIKTPQSKQYSPTGTSQTNINKTPEPKQSPESASHIRGLIARFDQNCSQPAVKQISVAADMVGLIIGEKGWFRKKVFEDTGVNISVEARNSQVSGPVTVTLIGPSVNLAKAVAMIEVKLGNRMKRFMQNKS